MQKIEVEAKLRELLKQLSPGLDLGRDLLEQFDSIQVTVLLNALESQFPVKFMAADILLWRTLPFDRLVAILCEKMSPGKGSRP